MYCTLYIVLHVFPIQVGLLVVWRSSAHFRPSMLRPKYNLMRKQPSQSTQDLLIVLPRQLRDMASWVCTEDLVHCCMVPYQKRQSGKDENRL